jgi:tetratricopeptide (TPR) repeat protein
MGILDSILPYTNRSLAVDEKQNIALNHMGFYYYNVHEFDKAKEAYEKSVAIDSTSRDSWYNLASSYYCMADYNNALRCYYKVLDIKNNKDKDALYYVINLLVGSNPNKAAQYAKMYKEQGGVLSKEVESKLPKSSNNPFSLQ